MEVVSLNITFLGFFFLVAPKTKARCLSNAWMSVALLWITGSRKSVELAKKRNLIKCEEGQIMTQFGV